MYPVVHQNPPQTDFYEQFSAFTGALKEKIPTFDKSLDAYFDRHLAGIIEEWELLTEPDLARLDGRLRAVTNEINTLYTGTIVLQKRVDQLDALISTLEKKR
jgi:hypothetical protein